MTEDNITITTRIKGYATLKRTVEAGNESSASIEVPETFKGKRVLVIVLDPLDEIPTPEVTKSSKVKGLTVICPKCNRKTYFPDAQNTYFPILCSNCGYKIRNGIGGGDHRV